jgi:hypothetical protein
MFPLAPSAQGILKVCVWNSESLRGKWQTRRFAWRFEISAGTRQQCSSCLSSLCFLGIRSKKNDACVPALRFQQEAMIARFGSVTLTVQSDTFVESLRLFVHDMGPLAVLHIVTCLMTRHGVIGFIDIFQLATVINYSAMANSALYNSAVSSLGVAW